MITIGQIISLFLILIVAGWIIKKIRGIIKWGIILVLFLVYGLGYSWSNAINVPVQHAQRLLNSLPVEQVKNNTRFDNGVLSIQLPNGQWVSAGDVKLVGNIVEGQNITISVNGQNQTIDYNSPLGQLIKNLVNGGLIKTE